MPRVCRTMRTLGDNLAWLLLSLEKAGLEPPLPEPWTPTHFIR